MYKYTCVCTYVHVLETQALNDIAVHVFLFQLSSLGIFPFFVENVSTLQLSSLKLVRTVSFIHCNYTVYCVYMYIIHVHVHVYSHAHVQAMGYTWYVYHHVHTCTCILYIN